MASPELLARLNPSQNAERFSIRFKGNPRPKMFMKKRGWYGISEEEARELREIRENSLNPDLSPLVFQVATREEAMRMDQIAARRIDPAGTAANPVPREPGMGDMSMEEMKRAKKESEEARRARAAQEAAEADEPMEEADPISLDEEPAEAPLRAGTRKKKATKKKTSSKS